MPLDSEVPTPHPLPLRYRCVSKIPWFDPTCKPRLSAPAQGQVSAHRQKRMCVELPEVLARHANETSSRRRARGPPSRPRETGHLEPFSVLTRPEAPETPLRFAVTVTPNAPPRSDLPIDQHPELREEIEDRFLRTRYDQAVAWGIATNRHRDRSSGRHPGYTLARRLQTRAAQVWRFTVDLTVPVHQQPGRGATRCRTF